MSAPIFGLAPQVCPLPADAMVSQRDIAQALGLADVRALLAACSESGSPSLPFGHLMAGEMRYDRLDALGFIAGMRTFLLAEPERKAAEQQQARERHEAAMRERAERIDRETAQGRERQEMWRANEAIREQHMAEAQKPPTEPIIIDPSGRRVW